MNSLRIRINAFLFIVFTCHFTWAQTDTSVAEVQNYKDSHWPYIRNYTPPFIGGIIGYNFLEDKELEFGIMYNLAEAIGLEVGGMFGPSIVYKRSLHNNINSIDLDLGCYTLLALGVGVNYNFTENGNIFGFRPFIGINLFHIQITYGYNILNDSKNDSVGLAIHSLRMRMVLPVKKLRVRESLI
jgi:hypothetical protein